jgi:N,N-dimethylformamidase
LLCHQVVSPDGSNAACRRAWKWGVASAGDDSVNGWRQGGAIHDQYRCNRLMRRAVDHKAMAVVGYTDPWSAPVGARIDLSLSADRPVTSVGIRRLDRDGMPAMHWAIETLATPVRQDFPQGAWAHIAASELAKLGTVQDLAFEVFLTRNTGRRVLLDAGSFALIIDGNRLGTREAAADTPLGTLPTRQWLSLRLDWASGRLDIASLDSFKPFQLSLDLTLPAPSAFWLCSDAGETLPTLNCRLGRLALGSTAGMAAWSFPTLFTRGALASSGVKINLAVAGNPTFCVTSSRWDGTVLDPRLGPSHYDAIHFHDSDMAGLDWPPSYSLVIPEGAESGVYAFEITAGDVVERIPFFVTATEPKAPLLFVVPTATYLAYADEYLPPHLYPWIGTDRGHVFARDNTLRSLYDFHSDASGVSLASTRKPKATIRDDYVYPLCGDPHLLPVDLHFLKFCARSGIALDLVTDFELHAGGAALLQRYKGVVTGSHPEYLSSDMEHAYRGYIAGGGKLAYLGGNGFAAAVAFDADVMELRRGPTQSGRTWDGPLSEMTLAIGNEPGGYFRDRGRGEYSLVGVGIALMGFTRALPFTRTEAGNDPAFAWLFEGVDAKTFGDTGSVLGGAAGYEVDCTNPHLGSPDDIVVLAIAEGFSEDYVGDPGKWFEQGAEGRQAQRRAEMTFWRHPSGGAVFSASSVAWCGALPGPSADTDVGRITRNLLMHFSK